MIILYSHLSEKFYDAYILILLFFYAEFPAVNTIYIYIYIYITSVSVNARSIDLYFAVLHSPTSRDGINFFSTDFSMDAQCFRTEPTCEIGNETSEGNRINAFLSGCAHNFRPERNLRGILRKILILFVLISLTGCTMCTYGKKLQRISQSIAEHFRG